ncbi:MAG TPA: Rid family detoxifying hydrolase [Hyphomicrobiaceae bacterium]|nr:Rid family detoxifying hydrolase [Hyphomicrobiaceae bacterium]
MRRVLPLFVVLIVACSTASSRPGVEFFARPGSIGPFSEAVRAGNIVFLSGMLGTDSTGRLAPGGVGPETRQTLENIKAALARNGLTMNDVVKCTVFLADIAEWGAMNQVYATYFPESKPARSAVGGTGLVRNARVEIECIAAIR